MTDGTSGPGTAPVSADAPLARWSLFGWAWPVSVLFHMAGNPRLAPAWAIGLLGVTAVAALIWRGRRLPVGALAGAVLVNVWLEAPILGNHWLLHGLLALLVLGSLPGAARPDAVASRFVGPARWTLLGFYSFAAFAKLNEDFFDPAVSCGSFYLHELTDSWGAGGLFGSPIPDGLGLAVAVAVAGIELAVPVLLVVRRTRQLGVLVALCFHFVLALDRTHEFFDFSSVLVALFLLFLDEGTADRVGQQVKATMRRVQALCRLDDDLAAVAAAGVLGLAVLVAAGPRTWPAPSMLLEAGVAAWIAYGLVVIVAVGRAVRRDGGRATESLGRGMVRPVLVLIPVLAVLNGLTPYLEVKSGTSWNMYANLVVADGESNHLVIRRSLPLTEVNSRLVEVTAATGVDLDFYVGSDWLLPERTLLDHIAGRPAAEVDGLVDGEPVHYVGGEAKARPVFLRKFQVFRAVDAEQPVGCQPSFGPAR